MKHLNNSRAKNSKSGFTIIEVIMVMLVVAIMAAVAIPQFINFRAEAKIAKTQAYLGAIRTGIANQYAAIALRCPTAVNPFPVIADLNGNALLIGTCPEIAVFSAVEKRIITDLALPAIPVGTALLNTVVECSTLGSCVRGSGCLAAGAFADGWCYNKATGDFWADVSGFTAY